MMTTFSGMPVSSIKHTPVRDRLLCHTIVGCVLIGSTPRTNRQETTKYTKHTKKEKRKSRRTLDPAERDGSTTAANLNCFSSSSFCLLFVCFVYFVVSQREAIHAAPDRPAGNPPLRPPLPRPRVRHRGGRGGGRG